MKTTFFNYKCIIYNIAVGAVLHYVYFPTKQCSVRAQGEQGSIELNVISILSFGKNNH